MEYYNMSTSISRELPNPNRVNSQYTRIFVQSWALLYCARLFHAFVVGSPAFGPFRGHETAPLQPDTQRGSLHSFTQALPES